MIRRVPEDHPTIAAALGVAVAGDVVDIAPGVYSEANLANPGTANITLQGREGEDWPIIDADGSTNCVRAYATWTVQRLRLRGASSYALVGDSTHRDFVAQDLYIEQSYRGLGRVHTDGAVRRVQVHGCEYEGIWITGSQSPPIEACEVADCGSAGIIAPLSAVEHCTVVRCAGAKSLFAMSAGNCNVWDCSPAEAALAATTYNRCNSFGNDVADYLGGAIPPGCSSVNPLLGDRLALTAESPLIGAGAASAVALDVLGVAYGDPPSIGSRAVAAVLAFPVGQGAVEVHTTTPLDPRATDRRAWALSAVDGKGTALVASVEQLGPMRWRLTLDRPLSPARQHIVAPLPEFVPAGWILPATFWPLSAPAMAPGPTPMLVDIDQPLAQGWQTTPSGAVARIAGEASLERVVARLALRARGSVPWAPESGQDLRHKSLVPGEASAAARELQATIEDLPGVVRARVRVEVGTETVFAYEVQTDRGQLEGVA